MLSNVTVCCCDSPKPLNVTHVPRGMLHLLWCCAVHKEDCYICYYALLYLHHHVCSLVVMLYCIVHYRVCHTCCDVVLYCTLPRFVTSPPIGGGRGIVMPMSVCLCVCPCLSVFVRVFAKFQSVISQPFLNRSSWNLTCTFPCDNVPTHLVARRARSAISDCLVILVVALRTYASVLLHLCFCTYTTSGLVLNIVVLIYHHISLSRTPLRTTAKEVAVWHNVLISQYEHMGGYKRAATWAETPCDDPLSLFIV